MAQPGHVLRAVAAAGLLTKGTQVAKWRQVCANWRVMRVFRILLCRQHGQEVSALHMCPLQHAGRQARQGMAPGAWLQVWAPCRCRPLSRIPCGRHPGRCSGRCCAPLQAGGREGRQAGSRAAVSRAAVSRAAGTPTGCQQCSTTLSMAAAALGHPSRCSGSCSRRSGSRRHVLCSPCRCGWYIVRLKLISICSLHRRHGEGEVRSAGCVGGRQTCKLDCRLEYAQSTHCDPLSSASPHTALTASGPHLSRGSVRTKYMSRSSRRSK